MLELCEVQHVIGRERNGGRELRLLLMPPNLSVRKWSVQSPASIGGKSFDNLY